MLKQFEGLLLLGVLLPYDPSCPSVGRKDGKLHLRILLPIVYVAFLEERRKGQENRGRQISERKEVKEEKGENGREEIGEIMSEEEKWKEKEERNM